MRALILVLAAVVVGLAAMIVLYVDQRPDFLNRTGPWFLVGRLLGDAQAGESATYRESTSLRFVDYKVEQAPRLPSFAVPWKLVRRVLRDPQGEVYQAPGSSVAYQHDLVRHGLFPLTAPEVPDALDRVWIVRSIQPDHVAVGRVEHDCWRVDLIDPALPEGSDTVVAWLSDKVPVFGLLKWKRAGETWEFLGGQFAAEAR